MEKLKIPKTTNEMPYIEFQFNDKGKLIMLRATNSWWGGKNNCFFTAKGYEGNTCKPEDLDVYIKAYKSKKIKRIKKEIDILNKTLKNLENGL